MRNAVIAVVLAFTLSACATTGTNFDEGRLANIHKGETTEQEVVSYFGLPMTQTVDSDGNRLLLWSYSHANAFGKAEAKTLMVQISNGAVKNYTVSKTTL